MSYEVLVLAYTAVIVLRAFAFANHYKDGFGPEEEEILAAMPPEARQTILVLFSLFIILLCVLWPITMLIDIAYALYSTKRR